MRKQSAAFGVFIISWWYPLSYYLLFAMATLRGFELRFPFRLRNILTTDVRCVSHCLAFMDRLLLLA